MSDDLIKRSDAVKEIAKHLGVPAANWLKEAEKWMSCVPSAQPLTDKEQRIFLAAMAREEKVCKEVDAEMTREPYEDSLVKTCHEIIRKVKGALWTQ